jgi:hypothetical protein
MGQTISQLFHRAEFAFRSGPAAQDQPRLDHDLSLVCEPRSRDAVDLQAASFLFLPLPLNALMPISEQDEPLVFPKACANCCPHQKFQMGDEHE